jgi:hypothetical protein
MFPKMESLWKQTPISRALSSISFEVPVKEPSLQIPLTELPQERHYVSRPFHLSKFLVNEPPSRLPSRAPMERDVCLQSLPLDILQGPQ